jgi:hypothetical protein
MEVVGLLVTLEARAGKEADAEPFLTPGPEQVEPQVGTLVPGDLQLGAGKFGQPDSSVRPADIRRKRGCISISACTQ